MFGPWAIPDDPRAGETHGEELEELDRELHDAYDLERDAKRAGDPAARDRARQRIAAAQAREFELRHPDS